MQVSLNDSSNSFRNEKRRTIIRSDGAPAAAQTKRRSAILDSSGINGTEIARGIARKELFLAYQPKFSIEPGCDNALSGVEALIRWNHPRLGLLRPDRIIPAVESAQMESELGDYVLHTAIEQVRRWFDIKGWSPNVAINLSATQLDSPMLCEMVLNALRSYGVDPRFLAIEITERASIRHPEMAANQLRALHDAGIRISVDDFGTGFASFNYLLQFPCDTVKICSVFVQGIGHGGGADEVCRAIIQLGRSLTKRVVAEGVETEEQLAFLRKYDCHEVQGFLLGRPMIGDVFADQFMTQVVK